MEKVTITKHAHNFCLNYHAKLHLLNRVRNLKKGEPTLLKPIPSREKKEAASAKTYRLT